MKDSLLEKLLIEKCISDGGTFYKKKKPHTYICALLGEEDFPRCKFNCGYYFDWGIIYHRCGLMDYDETKKETDDPR